MTVATRIQNSAFGIRFGFASWGLNPGFASILVALLFALTACSKRSANPGASEPNLPAVSVRVQAVESKKRVATEEVVGTVRAKLRSVIEAKVSGKIEKMLVVPGQAVKAGDLLVELDAREIQARLDQARALRDQAESELKRFTTLFDQKTVTQAEFDNVQARYRVALAATTEAETMLGYTKVLAPFDGIITRKSADVGDLATPGKTLLDMEDARALQLETDVPEAVIGKIALGDKLPVHISALEGEFEGAVSEIAPAADPNSRTYLVKLDLPVKPGLRAGQFGRVAMPVGDTTALRLPASGVVQRGQMEMVFVVGNEHAQMRLVKTGKRIGDEVELVSGVSPGESVVVEGAGSLVDGQRVTLK
jgi:RND family efflux transporter MFP subunit